MLHFKEEETFRQKLRKVAGSIETAALTLVIQQEIRKTRTWGCCFQQTCVRVNYCDRSFIVWFLKAGNKVSMVDLANP